MAPGKSVEQHHLTCWDRGKFAIRTQPHPAIAPRSGLTARIAHHNRQVSRRTEPIFFRVPAALLLISLSVIAAVWWWLATPVTLARAPIDPAAKLYCVSYAPFRGNQTPLEPATDRQPGTYPGRSVQLAKISQCVRTYSVDNGLDKVPELASKVGLKVLLGVWIGNNRQKNTLLSDTAISLAKAIPTRSRRSSSATR